jgi:uncharacterized protein YkwD
MTVRAARCGLAKCAASLVAAAVLGGCSNADAGRASPTAPSPSPTQAAAGNSASSATVTDGTSIENQVLVLVNQRRATGATCGAAAMPAVPLLTMHETLRGVARAHSQDMAANRYFSHTSLDGRSPGDRIGAAGYRTSGWAENIAFGQTTAQQVFDGWMNSPDHCNNIMAPSLRMTGVGFAAPYWTQLFTTN